MLAVCKNAVACASPPTRTSMMLRGVCRSLRQADVSRALRPGSNVLYLPNSSRSSRRSSSTPETRSGLASISHRGRLYLQLSKYRLSALVMSTTSAGYLAAGGPVDALALGAACVGTMLASSSANCFNQVNWARPTLLLISFTAVVANARGLSCITLDGSVCLHMLSLRCMVCDVFMFEV